MDAITKLSSECERHYVLVEDPETYFDMVAKFATFVDHAFKKAESTVGPSRAREIANRLPSLIALANTVSIMRGDNDTFYDLRPSGLQGRQGDLYRFDDLFDKRLAKLVQEVVAAKENSSFQESLRRYFYQIEEKKSFVQQLKAGFHRFFGKR